MKKLLYPFTLILLAGSLTAQITKISDIQYINPQDLIQGNDLSYRDGDTVTIQGIVTFDPCYYGLSGSGARIGCWLQDTAGGPWSAVHILMEAGAVGYNGTMSDMNNDIKYLDNFKIGNEVRCTGIVSNYSGNTQILLLPVQSSIQSLGTMPAPQVVTIDSFMQSDGAGGQIMQKLTGEKWEGVYVEFQNVTVVDVQPSGSRFYWSIQDSKGNKIRIRDASGWLRNDSNDDHCNGFGSGQSYTPQTFTPPTLGSFLSWIRGNIIEYNGWYYLAPRDWTDIGPVTAAPPVVSDVTRNPVVASSTQPVTIRARIWDPDGTVGLAKLYYSTGYGNTSYTEVAMNNTSGDYYEATIPASGADSTYMNFYIMAIDDDLDTTLTETDMYLTYDAGINSIAMLQLAPAAGGTSIWTGDTITNMDVPCVVTATLHQYDLSMVTVQDGTAPWSGIILQKTTGDGIEDLYRGDSIRLTSGVVVENFGVTYLSNVTFDYLGTGTVPPPVTTLDPDSVLAGVRSQAEAYEGMLVRFDNAYVFSQNPDDPANYGEWSIQTDTAATSGLRCDDISFDINYGFNLDSLSLGQSLPFIQGVLFYSFGNWKLEPRNRADIAGYSTPYPKDITGFAFLDLNPQVFCTIDQNTLAIDCEVPAGTDVTSLVPTVDYTGQYLSPASGVAQDFTNPVTYTVTAPVDASTKSYTVTVTVQVGIDNPVLQDFVVYPNPSDGEMNVAVSLSRPAGVTFELVGLNGQTVYRQAFDLGSGVNNLRLAADDIPAGMYMLRVRADGFTRTRQLAVMH